MARNNWRRREFPITPQPEWERQNRRRQQASYQRRMQNVHRPLPTQPQYGQGALSQQAVLNQYASRPGLSPEDTMYLNEWTTLPYEERLSHLRQAAQIMGFDKGWPQRNMQNMLSIFNQIPARQHVSMHSLEVYASHLPPPDQT